MLPEAIYEAAPATPNFPRLVRNLAVHAWCDSSLARPGATPTTPFTTNYPLASFTLLVAYSAYTYLPTRIAYFRPILRFLEASAEGHAPEESPEHARSSKPLDLPTHVAIPTQQALGARSTADPSIHVIASRIIDIKYEEIPQCPRKKRQPWPEQVGRTWPQGTTHMPADPMDSSPVFTLFPC